MKQTYSIILFLFVVAQSYGQPQTWQWGYSGGGAGNDLGYAISTTPNGTSYVTGVFHATATFGSYSVTSAGSSDVFVAKYDANGNCLWVKRGGSSAGDDQGNGIDIDKYGNCYVTGVCSPQAMFGTYTLNNTSNTNVFIIKYDSNGNIIWAKEPTGGSNSGLGTAIAVDKLGNSFVTGYDYGTFGSFIMNGGFVLKLDSSGTPIYLNSDSISCSSIAIDTLGNAYLTGSFGGSISINSQTYISIGNSDVFITKLDSNGNNSWFRHAGGVGIPQYAYGYAISTDKKSNVYFTGYFHDSLQFNSTILTSGVQSDIFIAKYDSSGNFLWAKQSSDQLSSTIPDVGYAIKVDQNSNAYITGNRYGITNFCSYTLPNYGSMTFVSKYDSSGNCVFAVTPTGGNPGAFGYGISLDAGGCAYITGFSKAPVTFGNYTTTFLGGEDMWIAKLGCDGANGVFEEEINQGISLFPNPTSGIFTVTLSGVEGQSSEKISSVEIINVLGEKVYSSTLNSKHAIINLKVPNGIYFYQIISEEKTLATGKLIISP